MARLGFLCNIRKQSDHIFMIWLTLADLCLATNNAETTINKLHDWKFIYLSHNIKQMQQSMNLVSR